MELSLSCLLIMPHLFNSIILFILEHKFFRALFYVQLQVKDIPNMLVGSKATHSRDQGRLKSYESNGFYARGQGAKNKLILERKNNNSMANSQKTELQINVAIREFPYSLRYSQVEVFHNVNSPVTSSSRCVSD